MYFYQYAEIISTQAVGYIRSSQILQEYLHGLWDTYYKDSIEWIITKYTFNIFVTNFTQWIPLTQEITCYSALVLSKSSFI